MKLISKIVLAFTFIIGSIWEFLSINADIIMFIVFLTGMTGLFFMAIKVKPRGFRS